MPLRATAARDARAELIDRLRTRSAEIEEAAMARVISLAELPERGGTEYAQGLRSAVTSALAFAVEGLALDEHEGTPVPEALLAQARRAARSGVGLDTVLRRYVAGHALLGDFLVQEAEGQVPSSELKWLFRRLAATLDVLLAAVTAAYGLEERRRRRTAQQRQVDLVERLLAGEPLDASELGYGLEAQHLGMVAVGEGAETVLSSVARSLGARLLLVPREGDTVWAWLGTRDPIDPVDLCEAIAARDPAAAFALGEPGQRSAGWRLTHRQARAVLPLIQSGSDTCVRYADVALLASVIQDDLLVSSLRHLYLEPLMGGRDGGATQRETLRAYFSTDQNLSSAAGLLGVDRRTVSNRLRAIEELIGRPLDDRASELQLALRLEELNLQV